METNNEKLTSCSDCGGVLSKKADKCPTCGAPNKVVPTSKSSRGCIIMIIVFFALAVIITILVGVTSPSTSSSIEKIQPKLELLDHKWKNEEYGISYIVGHVKNVSSKNMSYVQIQFGLYDNSGNLIGTAIDNVNNLESGGVWSFKALVSEKGIKTYRLKDLSGF